jgi:hypothetical protein
MKRLASLLGGTVMTRQRRVVAAGLFAAVVAGVVVAATTATVGGAAALKSAIAPANSVGAVTMQVQNGFGDGLITSAKVEGSLLSVKLALTNQSAEASKMKGAFEAQTLAHAIADWMRSQGEQPITAVRYFDSAYRGATVASDPTVSPLAAGTCESVAKTAATPSLTLISAKTLPWLNGTCVFAFQTSDAVAGSQASAAALQQIINAIGPPNLRPWFFELDVQDGTSHLTAASWMPDNGGSTWARPGLTYSLPHW